MNRFFLITALLVGALSLLAGGVSYLCLRQHAASEHHDALVWLRQEFALGSEQLEQIEQLYSAYAQVCIAHCDDIRKQRATVQHLSDSNAPRQELEAAVAKANFIDSHCVASVQAHAREIAAIIGGEQGQRYLSIVLPRINGFDHSSPPDLTFNTSADAPAACH